MSSLIGASFTRLTKSLRWESSTNMDNVEAMCWGRDVNGFRTLVLASDNNFSATQITQFHVFLTNIPAVPQRTLTTTAIGSGSITATPQLPWYPDGSDVALTAVPGTHHDFYRWEGDASGNANPLTLAMSANRSVSARFRSPYEQWKFLWFTEEEIFNSQITEPGQDPDADARDNLLEYAFGTVPTSADTGGFTAEALSPGHVLWNGSFETTTPSNPLPAGTQVFFDNASYVLSDWTEYNGANTTAGYLYHRNPTQWTAGYGSTDKTPFGNNVLGLGRGGASSVIQNLGQVSAGESYSLSGLIGRPTDSGTNPTGGYQMQLYLGATPGALTTPILTLNNATLTDPALGTWSGFSGTTPGITSAQDGQYLTAFIYAATGTWPSVREFDSLAVKQEGGLVAEFTLVESAADLSYIVQTSTDLVTWTDGAVYVPTGTGYTRTPGSGTYAVEAIDNGASRTITEAAFAAPDPATRQFIRIKLLK